MQLNNYVSMGRVSNYFTCHCCGRTFPDAGLQRRLSGEGQFCTACATQERCAACGEWYSAEEISYKPDLNACICHLCEEDYAEVAHLIKNRKSIF